MPASFDTSSALQILLNQLIQYQSISPEDEGCQNLMIHWLEELGFECQRYDNGPVSNFFARIGHQAPLLVFAGHTDVVAPGHLEQWIADPFQLTLDNGQLYGRGTADMKGALACMMEAAKRFLSDYPQYQGSLGFLITSGEEGDDFLQGTPHVMAELAQQGTHIDYCIVGEPSSHQQVGDTIKIGRRGSLSAQITVQGIQGHVAYPHLAQNPIHDLSPALAELCAIQWDTGNDYFPPTSMQITQIQAGGQAGNVIPGQLSMRLNFRFSTEQTPEQLKALVIDCFERHHLKTDIHWTLNGNPFLTAQGTLLEQSINVIEQITGNKPTLSTSGGTSDGRFIAPYQVEVIELGLCNASIHQINESIAANDLITLSDMYYHICCAILR